jgi:transcriptional regulator with XRE-family HTH domain
MDDRFVNYLNSEMGKRNLGDTRLAELSGMSRMTIYNVLTRKKKPGVKFCYRIAAAFGVTPESVMREAGISRGLSDTLETDISDGVEILRHLNRDEYMRVTEYARWRLSEQRAKYTP